MDVSRGVSSSDEFHRVCCNTAKRRLSMQILVLIKTHRSQLGNLGRAKRLERRRVQAVASNHPASRRHRHHRHPRPILDVHAR